MTHLRLVTNSLQPWLLLSNNNTDCSGILCSLIKYLSRSLGFSFEFIIEVNSAGYKKDDGNWTGITGRIHRNECDMTAYPFPLSADPFNERVVDFTHTINVEDSVVLTLHDNSWSSPGFYAFNVLDVSSWSTFIYLFFLIITLATLMNELVLVKSDSFFQRLSNLTIKLYGTLLSQDIQIRRLFLLNTSTLIMLTSWLISVFSISLLISGEITVWYSLKFPRAQIETLKELLDSNINLVVTPSFMGLSSYENTAIFEKIKTKVSKDGVIEPTGQLHKEPKYILDVSQGKRAIFLYEVPLKMITIIHSKYFKPNIKFRFIRERYGNPFQLTVATSRNLPQTFRDQLNFRVSLYFSTGIIAKELSTILSDSDKFFKYKDDFYNVYKNINMLDLLGLFKIVIISWTLCVIVYLVETCTFALYSISII